MAHIPASWHFHQVLQAADPGGSSWNASRGSLRIGVHLRGILFEDESLLRMGRKTPSIVFQNPECAQKLIQLVSFWKIPP